jgi:hypothetical protein
MNASAGSVFATTEFTDVAYGSQLGPSAEILALTGNQQLSRWNVDAPLGTSAIVTYSFNSSKPAYDQAARTGYVPYTFQQQLNVKQALDVWAAAGGIAFVQVPDSVGGQIRFNMVDLSGQVNSVGNPLSAFAFYPGYATVTANGVSKTVAAYNGVGGDVYLNANFYGSNDAALQPGQRGYSILLHEIGHAVGFKHPFEGAPTINPAFDNGTYTVMSYNRPSSATTLGSVDGDALRYYYGTSTGSWSFDSTQLILTRIGDQNSNTLLGTELADRLFGSAGNDRLIGAPGNDLIDGGSGIDTAVFSRNRADYTITAKADGTFTVADKAANRDGADTITNIERLQFNDKTLAFDLDGNAGQSYRMYQAAFARTPDVGGLSFWTKQMDTGASLIDVARNFVALGEFRAAYGANPSNGDIIGRFYQNVLNRAGEPGGVNFWVGELNSGARTVAQVLAGFSESPENKSLVGVAIANGVTLDTAAFM